MNIREHHEYTSRLEDAQARARTKSNRAVVSLLVMLETPPGEKRDLLYRNAVNFQQVAALAHKEVRKLLIPYLSDRETRERRRQAEKPKREEVFSVELTTGQLQLLEPILEKAWAEAEHKYDRLYDREYGKPEPNMPRLVAADLRRYEIGSICNKIENAHTTPPVGDRPYTTLREFDDLLPEGI